MRDYAHEHHLSDEIAILTAGIEDLRHERETHRATGNVEAAREVTDSIAYAELLRGQLEDRLARLRGRDHHPVAVRRDPDSGRFYAYCPSCCWSTTTMLDRADAEAAGAFHRADEELLEDRAPVVVLGVPDMPAWRPQEAA